MATQVIVLNGGSSSGKSGIARCLQAVLPEPWLTLGVDTLIRAMPVSPRRSVTGIDFASDGAVILGPRFRALEAAWIEGVAAMAHAGARIIVDEVFLGGAASQQRWKTALGALPVLWRLGFEAGLNAGIASARASLPGEPQPSPVALLDAVVEMIEREKGSRWRTDPDLRAGDWIQFEEEFRYGDAATAPYLRRLDQAAGDALSALVYFAATDAGAPFVLCGSSVHVLDRWQSGDSPGKRVGFFYMDALLACARQLAELPDEAAITEFTPPEEGSGLQHALSWLCRIETRDDRPNGWATRPVRLSGHARVLAVEPSPAAGEPPYVLATPLYVQYAQRG